MAYLRSFGSFLPAGVVANDELEARIGCEADWILHVSGIAERRCAADDEGVAAMGAAAARDCLDRAGLRASDIGMLIVASGSAGRGFPGPACAVAHALGLDQTPAVDVPMASAGALYGIALGNALAETYGTILVVAAERMFEIGLCEPVDRNVAILFGDGAGACLLTREPSKAKVVDSVLHSDGAFAGSLTLRADGRLTMDGRTVILQASRKLPRAIGEVLERNGMAAGDVGAFLMHQANQNLLDGVARALRVPAERFFSTIRRYGNTSSASMLIAAAEWEKGGGFASGLPVVFAAFGAGFHWGALLAVGV